MSTTEKTCKLCPSYLGETEAAEWFGVYTGAPMCASLGSVLGRPGFDSEEACRLIAKNCAHYGAPLPADPVTKVAMRPYVGYPTEAAHVSGNLDHNVKNCNGCAKYLPAAQTEEEFGWKNVGLCTAQAMLVTKAQTRQLPKGCILATVGAPLASSSGRVTLMPYFEPGSVHSVSSSKVTAGAKWDPYAFIKTDPRDWPTDFPVSAQDKASHVKAWRAVPDPRGEKEPIYMPVFDGQALCGFDPRSTYGEHAPELFVDHAAWTYTWAALNMGGISPNGKGLNRALALVGGAGTGKTEFFAYIAWLMDLPLYVISCRPDMSPFELLGGNTLVVEDVTHEKHGDDGQVVEKWTTKEQVTKFVEGRFLKHFSDPCVLVLDEMASLPDEGWFALRPVFAGSRSLTVEEHDLTKEQGRLTFIGLATNPDWEAAYRGVRPLSPAEKQRYSWLKVDLPDEPTERAIIKSHCAAIDYELPEKVLDAIMKIASEFRMMIKDQGLDTSWSIRPQVAVAQASSVFSIEDAYRSVLLDAIDPALGDAFMATVKQHLA